MTFFSGTDTNTLLQEGQDRNNIVSLIVNNDGTYSAAVTRHVFTKAKVSEKGAYQLFGDGSQFYEEDYETEDEYIEYFMFDIVRKEPNNLFSFIDRLKEIMTKKHTTVVASQPNSIYDYEDYGYSGRCGNYQRLSNSTQSIKGITGSLTVPTPKTSVSSFSISYKPTTVTPSKKSTNLTQKGSVTKVDFDKYIEGLALQIVTGNIFTTVEEGIDLKEFCKDVMVDRHKKRFGDDASTKSSFAAWVENITDFLVWDANHPELEGFNLSDRGELVAKELVTLLESIPTKNIYLDLIIDRLSAYI